MIEPLLKFLVARRMQAFTREKRAVIRPVGVYQQYAAEFTTSALMG
jgi:hypothetical protein